MNVDELYVRVSEAIQHANRLDDLGAQGAASAHLVVSKLEEQITALLPASDPEGALARRGAVRAAVAAGDWDRARRLTARFLSQDVDPRLRAQLGELLDGGSAPVGIGQTPTPSLTHATRNSLSGWVSYAHADGLLVEQFLALLRPRLATRAGVSLRIDRHIQVGQGWTNEVERALDDADFGLLCVSPSLMASAYLQRADSWPGLVAERVVIPFALEAIDALDLGPIAHRQVFRLRSQQAARPLSFHEARGAGHAQRFCDEFLAEVARVVVTAPQNLLQERMVRISREFDEMVESLRTDVIVTQPVATQAVQALFDEAVIWFSYIKDSPPPGWPEGVIADHERSLNEISAVLATIEGSGVSAADPAYGEAKERLAGYCQTMRSLYRDAAEALRPSRNQRSARRGVRIPPFTEAARAARVHAAAVDVCAAVANGAQLDGCEPPLCPELIACMHANLADVVADAFPDVTGASTIEAIQPESAAGEAPMPDASVIAATARRELDFTRAMFARFQVEVSRICEVNGEVPPRLAIPDVPDISVLLVELLVGTAA